MSPSAIEWTDETWNPTTGCDRVSPGCAHCYALDLAARLKGMGQPRYQRDGDPKTSGPGFGLTLHPDKLDEPLRWRKPRMVFVNSMSDLFHEEIPDEFIAQVFGVMGSARRHTFQILTKRPERAREWFARVRVCEHGWRTHDGTNPARAYDGTGEVLPMDWPLPNVWLGVSIENARYTWRADVLREIPAAVRFISAEPLLGSLFEPAPVRVMRPAPWKRIEGIPERKPLDLTGIDWVIVGGESGPNFRPMNLDWARELRDRALCGNENYSRETGRVPAEVRPRPAFFFKQVGGRTPKSGGRLLDGREWNERVERKLAGG